MSYYTVVVEHLLVALMDSLKMIQKNVLGKLVYNFLLRWSQGTKSVKLKSFFKIKINVRTAVKEGKILVTIF